ncbi:hypothetical protein LR48_Vigan03g143100 [Vigna angularis]|uniref:Uncharacterized protein n=1 Tax=Phaseolus angularis TaxID=3914 RepID=A0A0L9U6K5_PHAAN|nr:hypothetical protein LR48_Vigan03g143100 [Vigna angularis]
MLNERQTRLEETLNQFIQKTESSQKSTEAAIKNWEIQMGQIIKRLEERPDRNFGANTEVNPREECKVVKSVNEEIIELEEEEIEERREVERKNTFLFPTNQEKQMDFTELFRMVDNDAPWEQILQKIAVYTKSDEGTSTKKEVTAERYLPLSGIYR